ncbi:ATP-binding protein [Actinokineospora sp. UTMC 2448]|uniref:ATP-binding protein n=1 Tax=Actinokineospora sp. UTMC 2448 TaxID=2268449 RepID=UPI002164024E|nr:ATP-binding protein [Actinokineospora sp. UTMC 2448]UVS78600.1 hybrid sensory histidine kinase TorS [Actinokineospora sp. UTMC 2448]
MPEQSQEAAAELPVWRFPEFSRARRFGGDQPRTALVRLLAEDIARAWTPETGVRYLVDAGEFGMAETEVVRLGDAAAISQEAVERLHADIATGRARVEDDVTSRWRQLVARFDRVGAPLTVAAADLAVDERSAVANRLLADATLEVTTAEQEKRQRLEERIKRCEPELSAEFAQHVRDLAAAGELRLAEDALRSPGHILVPLSLRERPWPWRSFPLAKISGWLTGADAGMPSARPYIPEDPAGRALVASLGELPGRSLPAIAAYVAAVQRLVADVDVDPRVEERDGVLYTHLILPDDHRLPSLTFTGRTPVCFAIGDRPGDARFRLSLDVSDRGSSGHVVVDIAAVLSLLAPHEGRPRSRQERLVSLLRTMCANQGVEVVDAASLSEEHPDRLRAQVWWLLYLLGHSVTPVQLDALLAATGRHVPVLLTVVDQMVRVSTADLQSLRASVDFDGMLVTALREELGDQAFCVLSMITMFDLADEQGLRDCALMLLNEAKSPAAVDTVFDLHNALARLRERGYLPDWTPSEGRLTTCGCSVLRALHRTSLSVVHEVVLHLLAQHQQNLKSLSEDALYRKVLKHVVHSWAGQDPVNPRDDRANVLANQRVRRTLEDWMNPDQRVDLKGICQEMWTIAQTYHSEVDVLFSGDAEAECLGAPIYLRLILENLLLNGVQSAASTGVPTEVAGTVTLTLAVDRVNRQALIEVSDSGPGVPDHVRAALDQGRVPPSTKHAGNGGGLACAVSWAESLGGRLELLPGPSELGGARFRVVLPVIADA